MLRHPDAQIIFVRLPHNDRNVKAIPRIVFTNSLFLDVGRRTGGVGIQQVPERRVVEDEPAVVADGRVALRALPQALLAGHVVFGLTGLPRGDGVGALASFKVLLTALTGSSRAPGPALTDGFGGAPLLGELAGAWCCSLAVSACLGGRRRRLD